MYGIGELMAIIVLYLYINQTIAKLERKLVSQSKKKKSDSNDSLRIMKPVYRVTAIGIGIIGTLWSIGLIFQETILFFLCCIYQGIAGNIVCLYFTVIIIKFKQHSSKQEKEYYVYKPNQEISINEDTNENKNANKNKNLKNKLDKRTIFRSLFIVALLTALWTFRMVAMIQRIALGSRAPSIDSVGENIIFIYQIICSLTNNITLFTIVRPNFNSNSIKGTGDNECHDRNSNNTNTDTTYNNNNKNSNNNNNSNVIISDIIIDDDILSLSVTSKSDEKSCTTTSEMNSDDKNMQSGAIQGTTMQGRPMVSIGTRRFRNWKSATASSALRHDISHIPPAHDMQRASTAPVANFSQKRFHNINHHGNGNVLFLNQSLSVISSENSNAGANMTNHDIKNNNVNQGVKHNSNNNKRNNNNNNNVWNQSIDKPIKSCMGKTRSVPTSRSQTAMHMCKKTQLQSRFEERSEMTRTCEVYIYILLSCFFFLVFLIVYK